MCKPVDIELYKHINEHLKETDKKRDQLIHFYTILVAAFLGGYNSFTDLKLLIALSVYIIGAFVIVALVNYRRWHVYYVNCASVIYYIISRGNDVNENNLENAWGDIISKDNNYLKYIFPVGSVETSIFMVFLVITYIPLHILLRGREMIIPLNNEYYVFIGNMIVYILIISAANYNYIRDKTSCISLDSWPFKLRNVRPVK